ncbi:MAG TPA: nitroreductase family protein [Gemmatimonas sp.]|nr:nitroreductase family protein [Gemmatimonas sp.]
MKPSDSIATAVIERPTAVLGEWAGTDTAMAARSRRSVRSYSGEPIDDETVTELLTLTGRAPSAFNLQPWRFVVVRSADTRAALGAAAYGQKQITGAPVVIALYADMEDTLQHLGEVVHPDLTPEKRADTIAMLERTFGGMSVEARGVWANAQSNIALGYLLLLARAQGLDTSPMLGFEAPKVKALLGIPEHATVTALVSLGHGAEEGFVSHRHDVERITRVL